jgi:uncharacterized RDD family membrane protein YckC
VARLDDVVTIQTPEGVELDLTLAGLGSRFGAALVDAILLAALLLTEALAVTAALSSLDSIILIVGVQSAVLLATLVMYFVLFEIFNAGRTPGKAAFGIRVVDGGGQQITFLPSILRNLLRLVDFLPALYLAGSISILVSGDNRRIGDLAADSLVVHDRHKRRAPLLLPDPSRFEDWDVNRVTPDDSAVIRRFLERIHELEPDRRIELAGRLASLLREKVDGGASLGDEAFLRAILAIQTRGNSQAS